MSASDVPLLERANAAFTRDCAAGDGTRSYCLSMGATLDAYAAFHRKVFAPETPCVERRVLIVRESFSDVVGVGHAHMGLQRFLALGLAQAPHKRRRRRTPEHQRQ